VLKQSLKKKMKKIDIQAVLFLRANQLQNSL